jgi:hypothetical protein
MLFVWRSVAVVAAVTIGPLLFVSQISAADAATKHKPSTGAPIPNSQSNGRILIPDSSTDPGKSNPRAQTNIRIYHPDSPMVFPKSPFEEKLEK